MRQPYKFRGPNTWALVREAYLSGMTARECAEKFDVGAFNIKRRAANEGWTHRAHAVATDAPPPPRLSLPIGASDPPTGEAPASAAAWADEDGDVEVAASLVARRAVRAAARALDEGRVHEASQLVRTADAIGRLVTRHPDLDPAQPGPSPVTHAHVLLMQKLRDLDEAQVRER